MIRIRLAFVGFVSLVGVPLSMLAFACGGSEEVAGGPKGPSGGPSTVLAHEDCSESGNKVEALDTNGDGKPDIRRIFNKSSGREICRIVDLNHDGKIDMYEYYDDSGNVRRREYCYDETGQVNAVEHFTGGKLSTREYDTMGYHKVDTWDYFDSSAPTDAKTGRPTHPSRRERDLTGDGRPDQWWQWMGDNVTITVDKDGDGKPDPSSTITLDKNGQPVEATDNSGSAPPPAASSAAPASSASTPAPAASASSASPAASSSSPASPSADGGH
jgi:hypothetical protein